MTSFPHPPHDTPIGHLYVLPPHDRDGLCPDSGWCHHGCTARCWRVDTCEPLSVYGEAWRPEDGPLLPAVGDVIEQTRLCPTCKDWFHNAEAQGGTLGQRHPECSGTGFVLVARWRVVKTLPIVGTVLVVERIEGVVLVVERIEGAGPSQAVTTGRSALRLRPAPLVAGRPVAPPTRIAERIEGV